MAGAEFTASPALHHHLSSVIIFLAVNFWLLMGKENSPVSVWRLHRQCLNPCDPKRGAFGKIWERQRKENGNHRGQLEKIKKEVPEVNIPIPVGVFDTKEQES